MIKFMQRFCFLFISLFLLHPALAQTTAPYGFVYQAVARDLSGSAILNQPITVKVSILSGGPVGVLEWQETHAVSTDLKGMFIIKVGTGATTGNGTIPSFSTIIWQNAAHFIQVDINMGSGYQNAGTSQLFSVPYAFYSQRTRISEQMNLDDLTDVDTTGIRKGYILKWNGNRWLPYKDNSSDTVKYALKTDKAHFVDSVKFAFHIIHLSDTVDFSVYTDSSVYAIKAAQSEQAVKAIYSDTAAYATSFLPFNWITSGNIITSNKFLGTLTNSSLLFKTSALERMSIDTMGRWRVGTNLPSSWSTSLVGNDGFLVSGTLGAGLLADTSNNTRFMWYPKRAALRVGQVINNRWTDAVIGDYSTGIGFNPQASGIYSVAIGLNSTALDENCVSIGRHCTTKIVGVIINGGAIAIGDSCTVAATRSVAMGYKNRSDGGIVMGYKNSVFWASQTSVWGANNFSSGDCAMTLGSNTILNGKGSFIFSDTSSVKLINNNDYKFSVRASGGVLFYSDAGLTAGVQLFPGAGSWASVSDRNKKENFRTEDPQQILEKIKRIKILSWNYKSQQESIRHIGPTSQSFYSLFNVGENNSTINTVDMDGVILLGIKALEKQTSVLSAKIEMLTNIKSEAAQLDNFKDLNDRINQLEKLLKTDEKN